MNTVIPGLQYITSFCRDHNGEVVTGCEEHVCQNVILNLSPGAMRCDVILIFFRYDDMRRSAVGVTMSLVIVLSYILLLVPAREHIEGAVLRWVVYMFL